MVTSVLWLLAALALGFEAVAQPCELRSEILSAGSDKGASTEMACHQTTTADTDEQEQAPVSHDKSCCCAALLANGVTLDAYELTAPLPGVSLWSGLLADQAKSRLPDYEPPPPRA